MNKKYIKRFWNRVHIPDDPNACWEWLAAKQSAGYGHMYVNGKNILAHRISYILHNKEIPNYDDYFGMCVLHRCDNPSCVNPDHLSLGTHQDNMNDMVNKGRSIPKTSDNYKGEKNGRAKLSAKKVMEIVKYLKQGEKACEISKKYNVGSSTISDIKHGKRWTHIVSKEDVSIMTKQISGNRRLSWKDIIYIKKLLINRTPISNIANKFNVHYTTICRIRDGDTWIRRETSHD